MRGSISCHLKSLNISTGDDISDHGAVDADDTGSDSGAREGASLGSGVVAVCAVVVVIVLILRKSIRQNKAKCVSTK